MKAMNSQHLSRSIAQLVPNIIQGAHLGFLIGRTLTHTQFFMLISIHSRSRCTMKDLAKNMGVSMPTISGIVSRLVEANYIVRIDNPTDRRQVVVELTKEGKNLISQFQDMVSHRWEEVLKNLNKDEINSMGKIVTKLSQALQKRKHDNAFLSK